MTSGLEVGGVSPTGKSDFGFGSCRACERAMRGEAVWASERRFDREARAVVRDFCCCCCSSSPAKPCRVGCPRTMLILHRFYTVFR